MRCLPSAPASYYALATRQKPYQKLWLSFAALQGIVFLLINAALSPRLASSATLYQQCLPTTCMFLSCEWHRFTCSMLLVRPEMRLPFVLPQKRASSNPQQHWIRV
jgi:hypothetical protein